MTCLQPCDGLNSRSHPIGRPSFPRIRCMKILILDFIAECIASDLKEACGLRLIARRCFECTNQIISPGHHGSVPYDVFKLTHITRPGMSRKPDLCAMGQASDPLLVLRRKPADEVTVEQRQIFFSFRQPRKSSIRNSRWPDVVKARLSVDHEAPGRLPNPGASESVRNE